MSTTVVIFERHVAMKETSAYLEWNRAIRIRRIIREDVSESTFLCVMNQSAEAVKFICTALPTQTHSKTIVILSLHTLLFSCYHTFLSSTQFCWHAPRSRASIQHFGNSRIFFCNLFATNYLFYKTIKSNCKCEWEWSQNLQHVWYQLTAQWTTRFRQRLRQVKAKTLINLSPPGRTND